MLSDSISIIKSKTERLIKAYEAARFTSEELSQENTKLKETITEHESRLMSLEKELRTLRISQGMTGEVKEGNSDLKKSIDKYIKEIDKCIALVKA